MVTSGAMKILVVGSGGREHALVSTLARSPRRPTLHCAPGNAGIAREAACFPAAPDTPAGIQALVEKARSERYDLVVVGPEAPLVLGLADALGEAGITTFGPSRAAARLEGSKCFTKEFLARHSIPTAAFRIFESAPAAMAHLEVRDGPVVLKADGLAAGKGVIVARNRAQALAAAEAILVERRFGTAGDRLLVEDFLPGSELSLLVVTDGEAFVCLETAQDYKQVQDGDQGANTGGMGCYSPALGLGDPVIQTAVERIVRPTLAGLRSEGVRFQGVLYVGIMLTPRGPEVLEFNVRLGDPETQAVLFRLESDLVELLERASRGRLEGYQCRWSPQAAVCVVATSAGYPDKYPTGLPISGLEAAEAPDVKVFHAGTRAGASGEILTAGGRVLGVTARGATREAARKRAYDSLGKIHFEGIHFRRDIAAPGRGGQ